MLLMIFSQGTYYWHRVVPGFVLGSGGCTWLFTGINVALIQQVPAEYAGFAGALANGQSSYARVRRVRKADRSTAHHDTVLFQLGAVTGLSIQAAITNAIDRDLSNWRATQGGFWYVLSRHMLVTKLALTRSSRRSTRSPPGLS
jgi:hypothetical protein